MSTGTQGDVVQFNGTNFGDMRYTERRLRVTLGPAGNEQKYVCVVDAAASWDTSITCTTQVLFWWLYFFLCAVLCSAVCGSISLDVGIFVYWFISSWFFQIFFVGPTIALFYVQAGEGANLRFRVDVGPLDTENMYSVIGNDTYSYATAPAIEDIKGCPTPLTRGSLLRSSSSSSSSFFRFFS